MDNNENLNNKKTDENKETVETSETKASEPTLEDVQPKKEEIDYKAKYFYIAAEMDNFRKRMEREKENLVKYGNERILSDLLQIVDNFERTTDMLKHDQDPKIKNIVAGIDMVQKQFIDTLSKHGLTPVLSVGRDFDPNFHEAMEKIHDHNQPNGINVAVINKGYMYKEQLIKPATVKVNEWSEEHGENK